MSSNFKNVAVRSKKLREGGRGLNCVLCRVRPVQCGAHLPHNSTGTAGGGMAGKCPDWQLADLCDKCHVKMDGPEWRNDHEMRMRALCLTIERRFHQGLLTVPGEDHAAEYLV